MKVRKKKYVNPGTVKAFVYGTLKRDRALNSWMLTSRFVGKDSVNGRMFRLGLYPAVLLGSEGTVPGEVYDMPVERFRKLRKMEEDAGYVTVDSVTVSGTPVKVFEYADRTIENRCPRIEDF